MSFLDHASSHGLIIRHLIADDQWHRCPTTDHPQKKNGAYIFDGEKGAVQNWATMERVALYRPEATENPRYSEWRRHVRSSFAIERERQAQARVQAAALIAECKRGPHPYLKSKGFPRERLFVHPSGELIIPMREFQDYPALNTVQRISPDGTKLFLHGGKAKGSVYIVGRGAQRERWLCEGYATALSVQAALLDMRIQAEVICCFSAGNLIRVAELVKRPAFVMADNDESHTGLTAAIASGLPYVMPAQVGADANDVHQQHGLRTLVNLIRGIHTTTT